MNHQLIDYSPPDGDYVRYIDQLMQRSQTSAASHKAEMEQGSPAQRPAGSQAPHGAPGQTVGPPELVELMRRIFKKPASAPSVTSSGMPVVAVWWIWVGVALVIAGILFPMGIGWIVVVAFVLWRLSKAASKAASNVKKGRKS